MLVMFDEAIDGCPVVCFPVLFVWRLCMLREYEGERVTEMQVWEMDEVWLVQSMLVVHVVHVLCQAQLT